MAVSADFRDYVLEQLSGLRGLTQRRMFGGVGLYCDGVIFAIIFDDVLYFKAGAANRADFTARGMAAFRPYKNRPKISTTYYELPADVLEDPEQCTAWARRCVVSAASTR